MWYSWKDYKPKSFVMDEQKVEAPATEEVKVAEPEVKEAE